MPFADNFLKILSDLLWPALIVFLVLLFRKEVRTLLRRLQTAKLPGGAEANFLIFGEAPTDKLDSVATSPKYIENKSEHGMSKLNGIAWQHTWSLFWLGHDLMWTIDVILRGAPKKTIIQGLQAANKHAELLGFNSYFEETLIREVDKDKKERFAQSETKPPGGHTYHQTSPPPPRGYTYHETVTERLARLKTDAETMPKSHLSWEKRKEITRQIREIVHLIGRLAKAKQSNT